MKANKTLILMLAVMMTFTASINVWAAGSPEGTKPNKPIILRWTNTESINLDLSYSGTQADCSVIVIGKSGTSRIAATLKLQRKNANGTYTTIKTWSNLSANGSMLSFNDRCNVTRGFTYKLTVNATVYRGSSGENVSHNVEKKCE